MALLAPAGFRHPGVSDLSPLLPEYSPEGVCTPALRPPHLVYPSALGAPHLFTSFTDVGVVIEQNSK